MTTLQLEERFQRLSEAAERSRANLLELDLDGDRKLLEDGSLEGETAVRWAQAKAAIIELWRWQGALDRLLERAGELRGRRRLAADRLAELAGLLDGPSLELDTADVPLAKRTLLGDAQASLRCTPDELLERMAAAFEGARSVVAAAGDSWATLIPRIADARARLAECSELAAGLGGGLAELAAAKARLEQVSDVVTRDPLSVAATSVEEVTGVIAAISRELEAVSALQKDVVSRLAGARAQLDELEALVGECETAHALTLSRIADAHIPEPSELDPSLEPELARIAELGATGRWYDAHHALEAWAASVAAALDRGRSLLAAARAPLQARDELRALLDAYNAKAGRLGLVEDRRVRTLLEHARDELYTAPTDLAAARRLVEACQQQLNGRREVAR